jgi:hypothetical protein
VLVERDPVIAALWRYITRVRASEIRALPDVPHDGHVDDLNVCEEAKSLIGFWLNKGNSHPCKVPSMWMRNADREWASGKYARSRSYWGPHIRETIAEQVERVRHWTIIEGSYESAPAVTATWFIDPPYANAGKHYKFGSSMIDFAQLGEWCRARRGTTIVCENVGATWLPFERFMSIKANPSKHGGKMSDEAIFVQRSKPMRIRRRKR